MSDQQNSSSCASCVGRRAFLVQSALLAAAAALNACETIDTTAPQIAAGTTVDIADYPALANVGGVALATIDFAELAIVRTGTTAFVVLSRICQHQGGIVDINGDVFQCPKHGAFYSFTGKWLGGQPASNLISYTTSYNAETGVLSFT